MLITRISGYTPLGSTQSFGKISNIEGDKKIITYKNGHVYYTKDSIDYIKGCIEGAKKELKAAPKSELLKKVLNERIVHFEQCLKTIAEKGEVKVN